MEYSVDIPTGELTSRRQKYILYMYVFSFIDIYTLTHTNVFMNVCV